MDYSTIQAIGNAIDNVYNYSSEDGTRKTIAKLCNDNTMSITFTTILNSSRQEDLHFQTARLKKECNDMINSRLRIIKEEFKNNAKRALVSKKTSSKDSFETLTVSPHSPLRTLKYTCTYYYEVK